MKKLVNVVVALGFVSGLSSFGLACGLSFVGCAKPSSTPPSATPASDDAAPGASAERPQLTTAACEAQGGKVVGDIGDGAVHRPEYRCPDSGKAPIGSIVADAGGPVAIEGAVCCM